MNSRASWCLLVALLVLLGGAHQAAGDPTQVTSLPGLESLGERSYTGFIPVDSTDGSLFYWLFRSRSNPSSDPLVVWLAGGPGCSSELAAVFENGPYTLIDENQLQNNPYSWNQRANLLYIDQPVNTGFSFGSVNVQNSRGVANALYDFLQGFLMREFPEFEGRDVYITGEGYAGHYIPAIATRILTGNSQDLGVKIPLRGVSIGNGYIDPVLQYGSYLPYSLDNKVIYFSQIDKLNSSIHDCQRVVQDPSLLMYARSYCSRVFYEMLKSAPNVNIYNIQQPAYNFTAVTAYFNRPDVRSALHIAPKSPSKWVLINSYVNNTFLDSDRYGSFLKDLGLALDAQVRVLLNYGKLDLEFNYMGGYDVAKAIQWSGSSAFIQAPLNPYYSSFSLAGQYQEYQNLRFVQLEGAGQMVPHDRPQVALALLTSLISASSASELPSLDIALELHKAEGVMV